MRLTHLFTNLMFLQTLKLVNIQNSTRVIIFIKIVFDDLVSLNNNPYSHLTKYYIVVHKVKTVQCWYELKLHVPF